MATARLVASTYTQSSTSYTSITNASNMYTNTDSTNYATLQHTRNNNSTAYYLYIHGFNFSSIPANAVINSFTVKIKARMSGHSTGSNYRASLYYKSGNSWNSISDTTCSSDFTSSSTASTYTIPNGSLTWNTITGYGSNFAVRVPIRRSSSRTAAYIYIYGVEILVDYSDAVSVTGVTVSPSTTSVVAGSTVQLTATVSPSNASNKNVTWSSSNTSVATVNSSGLVTGVSPGSATITVTTADGGYTATSTVTVTPVSVTGVTVSPATGSIEMGETLQLTATVVPNNATNKNVTWSSSNNSIATVSNGLVTGVSAGNVTITVTTADGNYTATSTITITQAVIHEYVLANTMVVGKKYLIANGNSGAVHLLSNESGGSRQLVGVAATVTNNKISINTTTQARVEYECIRYTDGNDVTITVSSDNKYLYSDNSTGLRLNAPATLDRFWHYRNNKFWQFKNTANDGYSDASTEYKYYLELNNSNNFTDNHVTDPSVEDSDLPLIYIFEEYEGPALPIRVKQNGEWIIAQKLFVKQNGSWIESTTIKVKDNGTWK